LASLAYGQPDTYTDALEQPFVEGGSVRLHLASAAYRLIAGNSDRIVVRWKADKPKDFRDIRVRLETSGSHATIRTDGPARRADFTIEMPARSDVFLRMRAGEIKIHGIEGNKDIRLTAGELEIDMGAVAYSRVDASVTFGELDASPLGISKGGIARSFEWHGAGIYSLRASLFAGELNLYSGRVK
jgi:hypothetical protein